MKVGDLVIMPAAGMCSRKAAVGVIVKPRVNKGKNRRTARVGVLWSDGISVDMEPVHWLEVISESR